MGVESISGKVRRQCSDLVKYNGIALVILGATYFFAYPIIARNEYERLRRLQANQVIEEADLNQGFIDLENQIPRI